MCKRLFRFCVASLLFASVLAQAGPKSYIYIINNTGKDLTRGQVTRQKGQKYAPKFRKRIGAPKDLKGYTCRGLYCKADARQVFYRDKEATISPDDLVIKKGETVKIAEIDRNQVFLTLKNFKGKLPGGYKNPNPKKFKTILSGYPVFPFEELKTTLTGKDGSIVLAISSERIGLLASDYAKSIALGGVGALGGSLVPIGVGLEYIRRAAVVGAAEKAAKITKAVRLETKLGGLEKMLGDALYNSILFGPEAKTLKEGAQAARKAASRAIGKAAGSSLLVAVPIMIIGTAIAVGLATVGTIASLTVKAQKSGLTVLPFIEGNYKISQYLQERKGSRYPDLYITIWPK